MKGWTPKEIRELRTKVLGLSQEAFADRIGVTRRYVIHLEKGVRIPGKTLCILLDCMAKTKKEKEE